MLPDFPAQKTKLMKLLTQYSIQKQREYLGYLSTIPSFRVHEGNRWTVERGDGTTSESEYQLTKSVITVEVDEVPNLTLQKIMEKLDAVARDMARQMYKSFFEAIDQTLEENGRTIDAKGRRFTKELFLETIDSIEFDFDKNGKVISPAIIMHPSVWDSIKDDVKTWEQDSEFSIGHQQIIERKREAWRDRESHRKLVD